MTTRQQDFPETFLDDEAFDELEKAGNVKLSISQQAELNAAISYCVRLRDWHEAYSPDAIKVRKRAAKLAQDLKRELGALEKPAYLSLVLSDDEGFVHFMEPSLSSADPQKFMEQLDALVERGNWGAPDGGIRRPGRPKDVHLVNLCEAAAKIFECAGGTAAIGGDRTGPFADFICCLNDHIPRGYRAGSGDQLVKHAQNALSRLKNQRKRAARARAAISQKSPQ